MSAARHPVRKNGLGVKRNRARIAQTAARFIAEHGITDWALAKRKAARHLLLPETAALPSNEEIEAALADHYALFATDAHALALRMQRATALGWMRRLAPWAPLLVGGVAAGWATAHSDVRIELVADDPKAVEIALAGSGVTYAALPPNDDDPATQLRIEAPHVAIRLAILTPLQRRNRPRKSDEPRLTTEALAALLGPLDAVGGVPRGEASA